MTVTPQTNATLDDIARTLAEHDDFCLCGHVSPDGDCLGSQLALARALKLRGKRVTCVLAKDEPVEAGLAFLPGADELVSAASYVADGVAQRRFGVFVGVDVPTPGRLGDDAASLHAAAALTITVDHHAVDERMSDMSYTDPDAASTTMLVWRLAQLLDAVDEGVALCAYTGLMTDTGGFRFQNANAAAFQTASEMIAAGADPSLAATQAFCNRSRASLSLEALAIERASFSDDGTIAVSWLALDDFARLGAAKADASPVVNALRSIRGVRVAAVLREQEHSVRVSVRSKDGTDVSRVARLHDGGGHKGAAGFTLYGALDEACSLVAVELGADVAAQDAERGA